MANQSTYFSLPHTTSDKMTKKALKQHNALEPCLSTVAWVTKHQTLVF